MALNLSAPTPGQGLPERERGREAGPNPFLDEGWLWQSYEGEQDYVVNAGEPIEGVLEEYTISRGKNAGKTAKRYTGDVKDVLNMLNQAAKRLGIGVQIRVEPAVGGNGRQLKNKYVVHYLGTERRSYKSNTEDTENTEGGE